MPAEIVDPAEATRALFPDGQPKPTDPLGAAYMWWCALLDRDELSTALSNLTWHPPSWGDYEWARERLSGSGIMQFIERCPDTDDIAYVKFMPNAEHSLHAFGEAPVPRVHVLTMVLCPDGWWRAWGLSDNYFPGLGEVRPS